MISRDEASARVARGAAHLDQVRPQWFNEIDVNTLELAEPCFCIVGQLQTDTCYGNFDTHARLIFVLDHHDETWPLGIEVHGDDSRLNDEDDDRPQWNPVPAFRVLQDAWIDAIAARRHPVCEPQDVSVTGDAVSDHVDALSGLLRA